MCFLRAFRQYCHYVAVATLFSAQDLALIAALPLLERLVESGRLDVLVDNRMLVRQAESACKESA